MSLQLGNRWKPDDPHVLDALAGAEVGDLRLIYDSSNYVFLAALHHREHGDGYGVYKPAQGERPLHDFPSGTLHRREVAAYELSRLLGWDLVPPTIERGGPHGEGSMQLFIDHDPGEHYFVLREQDRYAAQLVRIAVFDLVANNADRKGGHILLDGSGHLWCIDNGLCFNRYAKLRTVVWDYAGRRIPDADLAKLRSVRDCIADEDPSTASLRACLSRAEVDALVLRATEVIEDPVLPEMYPYRCVPWPLI